MISLKKSELLIELSNTLSDGIVVINSSGNIQVINDIAERLLGLQKSEVLGKKIIDVIPTSKLMDAIEQGSYALNQMLYLNNTKLIVNHIPFNNSKGKVAGAVSVFRPYMESKELDSEISSLIETRTLLQAIIDSTHDAISVVNEMGNVILINAAYTRLTGLSEQHVLNQPATIDIPNGSESMHLRVLSTQEPVNNVRMKLVQNGKEVLVSVAPMFINNQLKGSVGVLHDVSEIKKLTKELADARRIIDIQSSAKYSFANIAGDSSSLKYAIDQAIRAAATPAPVLLRGESGTGKELFAHAIHNQSNRKNGKFVRVNCAALSENLLESELFGYSEGAFTGAKKGGKLGFFEVSDGGTLFLDEVGELTPILQSKLLRVLQEKEIIRVGETIPVEVDVRIIAATNANLEKLIESGKFREDLYYRINMIQIIIPPLRHRREDISMLSRLLINKLNDEFGRNVSTVSESAIKILEGYEWPGNIRELENILGRAIINMRPAETILDTSHLPALNVDFNAKQEGHKIPVYDESSTYDEMFNAWEKQILMQFMILLRGNKTKVANQLNISIRTLYYKLEKHQITLP